VVEGQGSEEIPWAKTLTVEALVEEIAGLQRAMERQSELLLELVKLWQGNPVEELERELGEIPEDVPGVGMYCEGSVSN